MATQPTNPDGFTGPDSDDFEYDWMANPATRDYSAKSRRVSSVEESLDGTPNYPETD